MENQDLVLRKRVRSGCFDSRLLLHNLEGSARLTVSLKQPNLDSKEAIEPPGTNSRKIFRHSSSRSVPRYLCKKTSLIGWNALENS